MQGGSGSLGSHDNRPRRSRAEGGTLPRRRPWTNTNFDGFKQKTKTYNRRDSQMVTHSSTSRPVQCLCMAERTGCPVLTDLWSYVSDYSSSGFTKRKRRFLLATQVQDIS
jgi:hypothetical protein